MISGDQPHVFRFGGQRWEGVKAIYSGPTLIGYAWVEADRTWDSEQLVTVLQSTVSFGMIWAGASALLVLLMSRSISKPLGILQGGTRALMEGPEGSSRFPLPVTVENEFADLIGAFNRGTYKRLEEITPQGHRAQIDLTITDDFPLAQAIVVISAVPVGT